jgi:hypothetical protein
MKTPKLISTPDGGTIINENDDDLFERVWTPEELRQAEERLEAFGKRCDERRAEWERNQKKEKKE